MFLPNLKIIFCKLRANNKKRAPVKRSNVYSVGTRGSNLLLSCVLRDTNTQKNPSTPNEVKCVDRCYMNFTK